MRRVQVEGRNGFEYRVGRSVEVMEKPIPMCRYADEVMRLRAIRLAVM